MLGILDTVSFVTLVAALLSLFESYRIRANGHYWYCRPVRISMHIYYVALIVSFVTSLPGYYAKDQWFWLVFSVGFSIFLAWRWQKLLDAIRELKREALAADGEGK